MAEPAGSEPGYRHPHVVIQNNVFNRQGYQYSCGVRADLQPPTCHGAGNVLYPNLGNQISPGKASSISCKFSRWTDPSTARKLAHFPARRVATFSTAFASDRATRTRVAQRSMPQPHTCRAGAQIYVNGMAVKPLSTFPLKRGCVMRHRLPYSSPPAAAGGTTLR